MYNRYIPQSDGTFRKNQMPDSGKNQARPPQQRSQPRRQPGGPVPPPPPNQAYRPSQPPPPQSAGSFLKQLLPQGLDTGDLLIAVLLLLMAGDCQEDKNTALLTLALYLFL